MEKASFQATLSSLPLMLEWVRKQIVGSGLNESSLKKIEISLEEVIVNIIRYSYPDKKGTIKIEFHSKPKRSLELTVIDTGVPFNPLEHSPQSQEGKPIEDVKEGGLGIKIMHEFMDELSYERVNDQNRFLLIKKLKP